jgi:CDP-diacylglycerol pyrophosphatase
MPGLFSTRRGVGGGFLAVPRVLKALVPFCALVTVSLLGASLEAACAPKAPQATQSEAPQTTQAKAPQSTQAKAPQALAWPQPDCGSPTDDISFWNDVKSATPANPGQKLKKVVFPNNDRNLGYAIHKATDYNYLLIPTIRESGIECPNLLDSGAPNYFQFAFENISLLPQGTDWALGIESAQRRGRNQFHIHVSRLTAEARTELNNQTNSISEDESKWSTTTITITNAAQQTGQQQIKFRAWSAPNVEENLFVLLNKDIVMPRQHQKVNVAMGDETLLVVPDNTGKRLIILNSDEKSPDTQPGADNIEFLLNKADT